MIPLNGLLQFLNKRKKELHNQDSYLELFVDQLHIQNPVQNFVY